MATGGNLSTPVALRDQDLQGLGGALVHEKMAIFLHAELLKYHCRRVFGGINLGGEKATTPAVVAENAGGPIKICHPSGSTATASDQPCPSNHMPPPNLGVQRLPCANHIDARIMLPTMDPHERLWLTLLYLGNEIGRRLTERLLLRCSQCVMRRMVGGGCGFVSYQTGGVGVPSNSGGGGVPQGAATSATSSGVAAGLGNSGQHETRREAYRFIRERLWPALFGRQLGASVSVQSDEPDLYMLCDPVFRYTTNLSLQLQAPSLAARTTDGTVPLLRGGSAPCVSAAVADPSATTTTKSSSSRPLPVAPGPKDYCVIVAGVLEGCFKALGFAHATVVDARLRAGRHLAAAAAAASGSQPSGGQPNALTSSASASSIRTAELVVLIRLPLPE